MKLLTEVSLPEYSFRIDHHAPSIFMGSCFTENIGRLVKRSKFPVNINPFGTTYNPASLTKQLESLLRKARYVAEDLDKEKGLWFSFDHYTGFSSPDRDHCLEGINKRFLQAKEDLGNAKLLVITWGTAWVFRNRQNEEVVCNCHKIPAGRFTRERLSVKEIIQLYSKLLPMLFDHNPDLKILITVSPVRHWKDGAHGNQLSKASLLLAAEAMEQEFPRQVNYFPSYEIVMDELRDYRYYAEDMLHPSETTTTYIWEKFQKALVSEESQQIISALEPLLKMEEHRFMESGGEGHLLAIGKQKEKRATLQKKYPFLPWE